MKNNKKRGFTLVELLVVIAILAILATVAVVGYTSFITRARVSNDEEVANQMNDFWTALRADSMGDYYGEDITQDNVWLITQAILNKSGLGALSPDSLKDGYHYYFRFNENGINGEYVVKKESELHSHLGSPAMRVLAELGIYAAPEGAAYDMPGIYYDAQGTMYFLVDTYGSELAKAVRGFYTLDDFDEDLGDFIDYINSEEIVSEYPELAAKLKNSTLVTKNETVPAPSGTTNFLFVYGGEEYGATYVPNVTITVKRDMTIYIPESVVDLAKGTFTLINDSNYNVKYDIINPDCYIESGFIKGDTEGTVVENGGTSDVLDNEGNMGDQDPEAEETYKYPVDSFTISCPDKTVNSLTKLKMTGTDIFVAYDYNSGSFTLTPTNFKGVDGKPYSSDEVIWSVDGVDASEGVVENDYIKLENGAVTIKSAIDEDVTITATAKAGGKAVTLTLKAVKVTGISGVKLGDEPLLLDGTDDLIFSNTNTNSANSTFSLSYSEDKITYNHSNTGVDVDFSISIENSNTELTVTNDKHTLALSGDYLDLLTAKTVYIKINDLPEKAVKIRMFNTDNLTFTINHDNDKIKLVGDGNTILLGDLFEYDDTKGLEFPSDAQVWFGANFGGTESLPGDIGDNYDSSRHGTTANVLVENWDETPIQFVSGTTDSESAPVVNVAIVIPNGNGGYRRISEIRSISVVQGYNIKSGQYSTLKEKSDNGNSIVLLDDVTMDVANSYFTIKSGSTFYGNCFTLDVSENGYMGGDDTIGAMYGIIGLYGNLQDTKIIGKVYGTFSGSANDKFGTNLIGGFDGATITNCYLSNTRSPLVVKGGTVTIDDTVLFGGRYANVDIRDGELVIKGNVTTVQQVVQGLDKDGKTVDVIGIGIAGWFEDQAHAVTVSSGANLKQYNFLDSSLSGSLPALSYSGAELMKLSDAFTALFTDTYKSYRFGDDYKYVNSGIVGIDKYYLNYGVTQGTVGSYGIGIVYAKYNYTVKLKTTVNDADTFTIIYDDSTYNCTSTTVETGTDYVKVTGAALKSGVVFEQKSYGLAISGLDFNLFDFYVKSSDYEALTVSNLNNYVQVNYPYEMGGIFSAAGTLIDFHARGMHYEIMDFDVWTPDRNNAQHQKTLEEYLVLGDTYKPTVFELTPSVE